MILNLTKDQFILVKCVLANELESYQKGLEFQERQEDVDQTNQDIRTLQAVLDKMNR